MSANLDPKVNMSLGLVSRVEVVEKGLKVESPLYKDERAERVCWKRESDPRGEDREKGSLLSTSESSLLRFEPSTTPPVLIAMCASISFFAVSTISGIPVTSKIGSLSLEGVMM